ncbi:MAG: GNAT family N-acetyltransferase [Deltaproteobacteria bacterium]|nr:MAG: GNAT family N-acetyltransferase [Deltaproteobacteria bacterium]
MAIVFKSMSPELWDELVELFGPDGASDGCWCMSWRAKQHVEGEEAKAQLKQLVEEGKVHGLLAFEGEKAIGWCSFGPRHDFPQAEAHLGQATSSETWSIPCFFVQPEYRGKQLGSLLLAEALKVIPSSGGRTAEGFPLDPNLDDKEAHLDWSFTGTFGMFQRAGFEDSGKRMGVYGGASECHLFCMECPTNATERTN